ncbi:MAG TPA: polyprenyl synthetase family protein [Ktedonobacterales bacterium]|nr:polyprenyl synthetase family protein [Ktedonobacterales bacterium]
MSASNKAARASSIAGALGRYRAEIETGLRAAVSSAATATPRAAASSRALASMYGQIEYHLGWRATDLSPEEGNPGKRLRPTLALLAAELVGGLQAVARALPAAVAVELIHNFSLIHDDIEDGDEARHYRPTLWKIWGQAQAINSGDALYSLARMRIWELPRLGVEPLLVVRLAERVDQTCLELCEGQHLDMSFEGQRDVTEAMYLDMIGRKTAALMSCAAELGARIGAPEDEALGDQLGAFGRALGLAFQLRDDVLGIWAAAELGKSEAGDVRRKKMTLPVIHALEHAERADREALAAIYAGSGPATDEQVAQALGILGRSGARQRAYGALREQLDIATAALERTRQAAPPRGEPTREAGEALMSLVDFIRAGTFE